MFKNLYLVALAAVCGLSACQRQQIGGFQRTHTESFARAVPVSGATSTVVSQPAEEVAVAAQPAEIQPEVTAPAQPEGSAPAQPVLLASAADGLVAASKGTKYEARALRMKAAVEQAEARGTLSAAPRKLNFAEKAVTKLVTKKLNKKIAKAERGQATQRIDSNISLGIVFLAAALILALLSVGNVYVVIAAVLGAAFLLIGLLNQAAG